MQEDNCLSDTGLLGRLKGMSKEGGYFPQLKKLDHKCHFMKRSAQHLWSDVHWHPRGEGEGRRGRRERRKDDCYHV